MAKNASRYQVSGVIEHGKQDRLEELLSRGTKLCPIEVKSSGYKSHSSLDAFCRKFSDRVSNRYLIYTKDLRKDEATLLIPAFMSMFL